MLSCQQLAFVLLRLPAISIRHFFLFLCPASTHFAEVFEAPSVIKQSHLFTVRHAGSLSVACSFRVNSPQASLKSCESSVLCLHFLYLII